MPHLALACTVLAALLVAVAAVASSGVPMAPVLPAARGEHRAASGLLSRIQRSVRRLARDSEECNDSEALSDRSISPWDHRVDHDPERYPATLHEAVCRVDGCATAAAAARGARAGHVRRLRSVPVTQAVAVLRRRLGPRGETVLVPDTHNIAVACVCVRDHTC
uniref:Interleukin-17D-like n=1 Tax=Petromyzon marinus TaxID=7757 RepID=A0AAJ7SPZ3_PETMA|nr:interleukin-17D-like [Petromyzon marinus]